MLVRMAPRIFCLLVGSFSAAVFTIDFASAEENSTKPAVSSSQAEADSVTGEDSKPAESVPAKPQDSSKQTYRLIYKFAKGESVHFTVDQSTEITARYAGNTDVTTMKSKFRKHFAVTTVDTDGSAELELYVDWAKMSLGTGNAAPSVEFDSSFPESVASQFKTVAAAIGKCQAKMKYSSTGKMLKVIHVGPNSIPVSGAPNQAAELNNAPGDPNQTFLLILPESEVAIGDHWEDKFEIPVAVEGNLTQKVTARRKYVLESVTNNLATIGLRTSILNKIDEPKVEVQLMQRSPSGKVIFDIEKGMIVSRKVGADQTVHDAIGPSTQMRAVSRVSEMLAPAPVAAAGQVAPTSATK